LWQATAQFRGHSAGLRWAVYDDHSDEDMDEEMDEGANQKKQKKRKNTNNNTNKNKKQKEKRTSGGGGRQVRNQGHAPIDPDILNMCEQMMRLMVHQDRVEKAAAVARKYADV
jgi:hypothetical protein